MAAADRGIRRLPARRKAEAASYCRRGARACRRRPVITKGGSVGLADGVKPGHIIALFCAFVWSGYSVLSRRFGQVPTDVVAGYCLITAAVAFVLHLALETTVWPETRTAMGCDRHAGRHSARAGFYAWDIGVQARRHHGAGRAVLCRASFSVIVLLRQALARFTGRWRSPAS